MNLMRAKAKFSYNIKSSNINQTYSGFLIFVLLLYAFTEWGLCVKGKSKFNSTCSADDTYSSLLLMAYHFLKFIYLKHWSVLQLKLKG